MTRKTFRAPIELKDDGEEGTFRSVFSTLNVIDHDEDVVTEGAFREGQEVVIEGWDHNYRLLPPGKGIIHTDEKEAWIDGHFFLDTIQGRDHYNTLKALGGLEEWSYTFDIEESRRGEFEGQEVRFLEALDVWGVAPVVRGASIDTRTVALKSAGLTDEEIKRLRELLQKVGNSGIGEGEAGDVREPQSNDGKPSGISPGVVLAQVDILEMEE